MTFADKVIEFIEQLTCDGIRLPAGIRIMNPYREDSQAMKIAETFYHKFYNDNNPRSMILGINPGRFGGGVTGIPFTDTKRLQSECGIAYNGKTTHEPSSVFVYEMINAFGGVEKFYSRFYINSVFPLGLTASDEKGKEKNYNYHDSKELLLALRESITDNISKQVALGIHTGVCFCFGTGKNEDFLRKLNEQHGFFKKIVALEHPRFIVQYKSRFSQYYIEKYIAAFNDQDLLG